MVNVKMEGKKVVVEFEIIEYYELIDLLQKLSQYPGTGTGLTATTLLQKLKEAGRNDE